MLFAGLLTVFAMHPGDSVPQMRVRIDSARHEVVVLAGPFVVPPSPPDMDHMMMMDGSDHDMDMDMPLTPVQTFAWASWVQPGIYSRSNGGTDWALQDIHALSHEIAEWADDPFVNNTVEPWLTPTAPQYGCTGVLETGDPVVAIGFAMGTNTFEQGPNPNSTLSSADGYYHPEDEAFLPWFMRTAPNNVSEPTQSPSANGGRYTLMGSLNPFQGFRQPATGC